MIFIAKITDDYDDTFHLEDYQPYHRYGQKNPKFDKTSGRILDLKQGKAGVVKAVCKGRSKTVARGGAKA